MHLLKLSKNLNATGLVEVLVALGILAIAMVSVVSVTTRGLRQVKKDEIEDQAIGLQLQALELAKSPATLTFPTNLLPGDIKDYYLVYGDGTVQNGPAQLLQSPTSVELSTDNCDTDSVYYLGNINSSEGNVFCNQIVVSVKSQQGKNFYEIKSIVVFKSTNGFEKRELLAFRRD